MTRQIPILFSGPMVQAILAGRKSQTRRLVKPQPFYDYDDWVWEKYNGPPDEWPRVSPYGQPGDLLWVKAPDEWPRVSPYGQPGDLLWVKEAWRTYASADAMNATAMAASCIEAGWEKPWAPVRYEADGCIDNWDALPDRIPGRYRTARFMPKWLARLWLRVTDVRVDLLQEITLVECLAEGCDTTQPGGRVNPLGEFQTLWDSLNAKRGYGWETNPFVWVVSFERTERPDDV